MQRKRRRISKEPVDIREKYYNDTPEYSYKMNNVVAHKQKSASDNIKEIWNLHTSVQEQLLNARSMPIRIVSDSIRIVGDKMLLSVDERNSTDSVLLRISELFKISFDELNIALEDGYFVSDIEVAQNIETLDKQRLAEYHLFKQSAMIRKVHCISYKNIRIQYNTTA